MRDSRRVDTSLIDSALASRSRHVRAIATLAVGQVGADDRAAMLATLLGDADTAVAANAAFALGLLRDSAAVPALGRALARSASISLEAAWALGEIGEPARGAIEEALSRDPVVGHLPELLRAAAKLRPVPVAIAARFIDGPDSVRVAALYALSRSRPPAAVRHLVAISNARCTAPSVAAAESGATIELEVEALASVARGLVSGSAGDSLGVSAREALACLVRHPHPHVRINALRSLATFGATARTAIVEATRDEDPNVRITAAQSLGSVIDSTPSPWSSLWAADTAFAYRAALLVSAAQGRSPGLAMRLSDDWATHADWRFRSARAAALAASRPGPWREGALLASLVADADPRVRAAALGALADSAAPAAARQRLLSIAVSDSDAYVRGAALGALAARARASELAAAVQAYRRAQSDSVDEARLAAISLVAAVWRRDSAAISAADAQSVASLPPPVGALERVAGRAVPILSHWPGPEGTPRPLEWYEERVRMYVEPALAGRPAIAELRTERGPITIELAGADSPLTVDNFVTLAAAGYYTGTRFHRVVPNFVAQDGDPRGDGNGGPGYAIRDELNRRRYARGALGMALSGPHTGGSQYFLTHSPHPHLDGHYTVFGRMVAGWNALDAIVQGDRILQVIVR